MDRRLFLPGFATGANARNALQIVLVNSTHGRHIPEISPGYAHSVSALVAQIPPPHVGRFRDSMPPAYRRTHGGPAIEEHAAIVERRAGAAVHIELWRVRRGTVIVVVSDDHDGGLAMMSAAIAAAGFDILLAEAYLRTRDVGPDEAIAFFELRRPGKDLKPITAEQLIPIRESLESLLLGEARADSLLQRNAPTTRPGPQAAPEVAFAADDNAAILLVEARDRPGFLATITSALTEARARIVDSEIATVDGRARDRLRLTELDGSPLSEARRVAIVTGVLAAIERGGISHA